MRRQWPAFVPFSTNICSPKRRISISPELHEDTNASSSVGTSPRESRALKERAVPTAGGAAEPKRGTKAPTLENNGQVPTETREKETRETREAALQLEGQRDFNSPESDLSCATGSGWSQCGEPCWAVHLGRRPTPPHRTGPENPDAAHDGPDTPPARPFRERHKLPSPRICSLLSSNSPGWVAKLKSQFSICQIPHLRFSEGCHLPWVTQGETA